MNTAQATGRHDTPFLPKRQNRPLPRMPPAPVLEAKAKTPCVHPKSSERVKPSLTLQLLHSVNALELKAKTSCQGEGGVLSLGGHPSLASVLDPWMHEAWRASSDGTEAP